MEKKATGIQAFFSPNRILFGIDAVKDVAAEVKQLGGNPTKFAQIAGAMGEEVEGLSDMEAAPLAVEVVKELLNQFKIPIRLSNYDIPQKDIPRLVEGAMNLSHLFVTNPRNVTHEDVGEIYRMAW